MWIKNLKVLAVAFVVLGFYTMVAHIIPQIASEVPKEIDPNNMTSEQMVSEGEKIFNGSGGCTACHGLGTRAPNLVTDEKGQGQIGARCGKREPGKDCKAYLYESLTEPQKYVVAGYGPIMPDMRRTLSNAQIWATIAFLESQGGDVTVTPDDVKATGGGGGSEKSGGESAGGGGGGAEVSTTTDPKAIITEKGCPACHKLGTEGGEVAPPFNGLGTRVKGDKDYIRQSIIDPDAKIAKGYENFKGMMPKNFGEQLSAKQLEILVNFLASQK